VAASGQGQHRARESWRGFCGYGVARVSSLLQQPLFDGGEAANNAPCSIFDRFCSSLSISVSKLALFYANPMGFGVDDRAIVKSLRDADDGNAYGHRHLLGGVFMVLIVDTSQTYL
jgi:hypothetical protein